MLTNILIIETNNPYIYTNTKTQIYILTNIYTYVCNLNFLINQIYILAKLVYYILNYFASFTISY